MQKSIIYENTDDTILIWTTDLIDIVRGCIIEDTLTSSMREEYGKLVSRLEEFSDYSPVVRILKPESKISIGKFCEIYSGILLTSGIRSIFKYYSMNKKVILYTPIYMINSIIRRIIGRPKVIAISTSSVLNTNHWLDDCINKKFKEWDKQANDFVDSFSYCMRNINIDVSSMHPEIEKYSYCENDAKIIQEILSKPKEELMIQPRLRIKNVIFNDPATIVFWWDGTKTVVKAQEGDKFDPEKGLAMAVCKKVLGYNDSQSNFNKVFKHWLPKEEKKEPKVIGEIKNMTMTDKGLVVEAKITDAVFAPRINEILGILGE